MTCRGRDYVLEGGESFIEGLVSELRLYRGKRGGGACPGRGMRGVGGVVGLVLVLNDFDLHHRRCVALAAFRVSRNRVRQVREYDRGMPKIKVCHVKFRYREPLFQVETRVWLAGRYFPPLCTFRCFPRPSVRLPSDVVLQPSPSWFLWSAISLSLSIHSSYSPTFPPALALPSQSAQSHMHELAKTLPPPRKQNTACDACRSGALPFLLPLLITLPIPQGTQSEM